jgi:hypothetical protein
VVNSACRFAQGYLKVQIISTTHCKLLHSTLKYRFRFYAIFCMFHCRWRRKLGLLFGLLMRSTCPAEKLIRCVCWRVLEELFRNYEGCVAVRKRGRTALVMSEMLQLAIQGCIIDRICELYKSCFVLTYIFSFHFLKSPNLLYHAKVGFKIFGTN